MLATKTALIYRPFLGLEVKQDIDTMLYCANDLLEAYNKQDGVDKKRMDIYMTTNATQEYVKELSSLSQYSNSRPERELNGTLDKPINEKSKIKGVVESKKGKFGGTWMCDHLIIDFMMWLSPKFKHQAIDFILNGNSLALGRNKIKEGYKKMCLAIANSGSANYREETTMINILTSGSPSTNQRARYGLETQDLVDDIQKMNAGYIVAGLDIETRRKLLRDMYIK